MRFLLILLTAAGLASAQQTVWSEQEKPIVARMKLRALPDAERGPATRQLALDIRQLPASPNKLRLASGLANLSTEGDLGRDTLQEVATTLAGALRETPGPAGVYHTLAQLVRYEGVRVQMDAPQFKQAMSELEQQDRARAKADFTLTDLNGKTWTLHALKGKVVLVNFWATWCPPCRKEMPDLDALAAEFPDLVVLAISNEEEQKVRAFSADHRYRFPLLMDKDGAVSKRFFVEGIPKTFIFDRQGKLAAQSIDMRTRKQFLDLLAKAGLTK